MKAPKIQALLEQINSGKLKSNNAKVLSYIIDHYGSCIDVLRTELNIAHQTVTSCISHMEDEGIIYAEGTVNTGEREYTLYRYEAKEEMRKTRANMRKLEKFEAWRRRGLKDFKNLMHENLASQLIQPTLF